MLMPRKRTVILNEIRETKTRCDTLTWRIGQLNGAWQLNYDNAVLGEITQKKQEHHQEISHLKLLEEELANSTD